MGRNLVKCLYLLEIGHDDSWLFGVVFVSGYLIFLKADLHLVVRINHGNQVPVRICLWLIPICKSKTQAPIARFVGTRRIQTSYKIYIII